MRMTAEFEKARAALGSPQAEALLDALERSVDALDKEAHETAVEAEGLKERLSYLEGGILQETVVEAIQKAHEDARHRGRWTDCPNPVCRNLEDWFHHLKKTTR